MAVLRRSVIEEGNLYRVSWQFYYNSISFMSLFGGFLILLQYYQDIDLAFLLSMLIIGVSLELVLSIIRNRIFAFVVNFLPVAFTYIGYLFAPSGMEPLFTQFFIFFLGYSVINAVASVLLDFKNATSRSLGYAAGFLNKAVWMLLLMNLFRNLSTVSQLFVIESIDFSFNATVANIYLVINLSFLLLSVFAGMLLLIGRYTRLMLLADRLKRISSWSLDHDIIEEKLIDAEVTMKPSYRTVLFGDIRGFTAFSEVNEAKVVVAILERLYFIVENTISEYGGFKPEFIADEFITFFDDTKHAVDCSLALGKIVNDFLEPYGLGIGIGIEVGNVLEGLVGSHQSKKYTVIGQSVNVAARLQASAKARQILVSREVLKQVKGLQAENVPGLDLKGVSSDFEVFSLLGYQTGSPAIMENEGVVDRVRKLVGGK